MLRCPLPRRSVMSHPPSMSPPPMLSSEHSRPWPSNGTMDQCLTPSSKAQASINALAIRSWCTTYSLLLNSSKLALRLQLTVRRCGTWLLRTQSVRGNPQQAPTSSHPSRCLVQHTQLPALIVFGTTAGWGLFVCFLIASLIVNRWPQEALPPSPTLPLE